MYKIIGADGLEYGPVSAQQLRQWIAEGRANAQTRVLAEGALQWCTLGELPEFCTALAQPTAPTPTPLAGAPTTRSNSLATAGLVLGLLSMTFGLCCCYGFPFSLAGIICSAMALSQIHQDPQQTGRGLAIAGLVLSILGLLLGVLFFGLGFAFNSSHWMPKSYRL